MSENEDKGPDERPEVAAGGFSVKVDEAGSRAD